MKKLSFLIVLVVLACAAIAGAQPAENVDYGECLAIRLVRIAFVAKYVEEKATAIEPGLRSARPAARQSVAQIKKDARTIRVNVQKALDLSSASTLETALIDNSIAVSWLRSTLSGLALDLATEDNPAAFQATKDMGAALDALRTTIPAEDPTRGCR
jgi:hypothetical protein